MDSETPEVFPPNVGIEPCDLKRSAAPPSSHSGHQYSFTAKGPYHRQLTSKPPSGSREIVNRLRVMQVGLSCGGVTGPAATAKADHEVIDSVL